MSWASVRAVQIICGLRATLNEAYSLASQRGLSKSSAGRLPLPFPVGQPGRVYFTLIANNIVDLMQTQRLSCSDTPMCLAVTERTGQSINTSETLSDQRGKKKKKRKKNQALRRYLVLQGLCNLAYQAKVWLNQLLLLDVSISFPI